MPCPTPSDSEILDAQETHDDQNFEDIINKAIDAKARAAYFEGVAEERARVVNALSEQIVYLRARVELLENREGERMVSAITSRADNLA